MPRIRSVEEIQNVLKLSDTPDKLARRYLIKQIDKLVRSTAADQQNSVTFEIPCIIVFRPRYNRDVLTRAVSKHYKNIGFGCEVDDYTLTISWGSDSDDDSSRASQNKSGAPCDESAASEAEASEASDTSDQEEQPIALKFCIEGARPSMAKRVAEMKTKKA